MFCSQCGKKLKDTMLFCPNCGAAIELPDDDDEVVEAVKAPEQAKKTAAPEKDRAVESADDADAIRREDMPSEENACEDDAPVCEEAESAPEMPVIIHEAHTETAQAVSVFQNADKDASDDDEEEITFDEEDAPEFVPLQVDDTDEDLQMTWEKFEPKVERKPPVIGNRDDDVQLNGHAPRLKSRPERTGARPEAERREKPVRSARTYVPAKPMDPDDMFMDASDPYDEFDDMEFDDLPDGDFEYEEEGESSFFLRHIRGIMGLSLMALLALVCMIYVFSETGQIALAKMNLAWNPEVYSMIAYDYYQGGLYEMSGNFYEKALDRDEDNYNYAISAASAYIYAEQTDKAASMLKKSIALNPVKVEPYIYLMNIYPDQATRPWDVSQLLQQGYGRTGDDRLKPFAQ